ncbi:MFS transporter [Nonomuraea sp. NPDC049625]|uniref:MFS transporter n=1 Tax=Nonomuraea sp. NPDC049625 TaxID=3155775 RepID=UPI00343D072B
MRAVAGAWVAASTADSLLIYVVLWAAGPQGWSGVQTAFAVLALRLPALLGGVVGGRAIDRYGPRLPFLADLVTRAALLGILAAYGWSGDLPLLPLLVLGAACGALSPISYSCVRVCVPLLVPQGARTRANALMAVGDQLPLVLGALLTASLLGFLGLGPSLAGAAALLLAAAAFAPVLPMRQARATVPEADLQKADLREASPWRSSRIRTLVALSVVYYAAYGPFESVLPEFVRDRLDGNPVTYSMLWVLFGTGALAALPLAPRLARRRPGLVNGLGATLWGAVTLPLALLHDIPAAAALFAVSGLVWGPYTAVEATALQRWAHPNWHGRLFGTQRALLMAASPLGAAAGAILLDHSPPAAILAGSAAACAVAGLVALAHPAMRRA